ncbi:MAG TPA: hypothetical protein PKA63_11930 [Oligoflexia bacterium]|nr:hypothetical protein [Oligoflexia bacterium]HMP49363.1 hypothetical protein [Oligoflexia bacterium]
MKRILGPLLTFIGGLYFFLEFLLPEKVGDYTFGKYHQELSLSLALISSMAVGLGVINLGMVHGRTIVRKSKGFIVSLFLILSFILTLSVLGMQWYGNESRQESWNSTLALISFIRPVLEKEDVSAAEIYSSAGVFHKNISILKALNKLPAGTEEAEFRKEIGLIESEIGRTIEAGLPDNEDYVLNELKPVLVNLLESLSVHRLSSLARAKKESEKSSLYKVERLIIHGLFYPLGLSMFSLLAFYIAYAAYRSFRVRSLEAAIMMCSAFIVLLGQVPQGVMYLSEDLPYYRLWIMEYLSTPAFRAIYFSSAIAGLSLAVRMWLSLDKNPFSSS